MPPASLIQGRGCIASITYNPGVASGTNQGLYIYDGASSNGQLIYYNGNQTGGSSPQTPRLHALHFEQGIYIATDAAGMTGTITAWIDHDCAEWLELGHLLQKMSFAEVSRQLGL